MPKTLESPNGVATGFRMKASTRRVTPDPERWPMLIPEDGSEPFWAEIRDDLTFADIAAIPITGKARYIDQWTVIAPWVVGWNAIARDLNTGEWVAVAPPAELGVEAFTTQSKYVTAFLVACFVTGAGSDLPKGPRRTGDTGDGLPAAR